MILTKNTDNPAQLSNVSHTSDFQIKATAKSFRILSSGLYSNKIKAIIRELSTNALDGHKLANKEDISFEVHLPSLLEPWFSVRDFGIGLDHNEIVTIFTVYFESTKTESNDFIGGLGLGSKSPFSYTNNFSITSVKNNVQNIYSAFINDMGVPSVALMSTSETLDCNGVEVKFSVTNQNDYRRFRDEAAEVYRWFKDQPTILGDFRPAVNNYERTDIIPGVHLRNYGEPVAIMGNICYPLNGIKSSKQELGELSRLLMCPLVIYFDIGELDFAASREELSYIPSTIQSIIDRLRKLSEFIEIDISNEADKIDNKWLRAMYLSKLRRQDLYAASVESYIARTGFELCNRDDYSGTTIFRIQLDDLLKDFNISVQAYSVNRGNTVKSLKSSYKYVGNDRIETIHIPVQENATFVLNDLKIGAKTSLYYHFGHSSYYGNIYLVNTNASDDKKDEVFSKFLNYIHNPPTIIKASTLNKKPRQQYSAPAKVLELIAKENSYSNDVRYTWGENDIEISETDTYVYVPLTSRTPLMYNSKNELEPFEDFSDFIDLVKSSLLSSKIGNIYGVRKSGLAVFANNKNCTLLVDKVVEEVNLLTAEYIKQLIIDEFFDSNRNTLYTLNDVADLLKDGSMYKSFVKSRQVKKSSTRADISTRVSTIQIIQKYHKQHNIEELRAKIRAEYSDLKERYPLLSHLYENMEREPVLEYIRLVDNSLS